MMTSSCALGGLHSLNGRILEQYPDTGRGESCLVVGFTKECERNNFPNRRRKSTKVQYTYKKDNKYIIVDDVPCEQCEYCGEQYFEANVLKNMR